MIYNAESGKELMERYLGSGPKPWGCCFSVKLAEKLEHSIAVGEFSAKVARKIAHRNPELDLDADLCEFLGYVHDIGYFVAGEKHEVCTVEILGNESVKPRVARMAMHGQLVEQYGILEGNLEQYFPAGIEGMILTYCDMSVKTGNPISIRERAAEIIERVKSIPTMPGSLKKEIEDGMHKALPRFERYEQVILALAGVSSSKDF